jgi:hypothetical protein
MRRLCGALLAGAVLGMGAEVRAQGYRLRLDTRLQTVSFRGLSLDSIAVTDTVSGPGGGPATPDGLAVTCLPGHGYCHFYRPGPEQRGAPIVSSADLSVWGFGIPGLSARILARAAGELRDDHVWPGTTPRFQLIEGYLEYARPVVTARLGRQVVTSRLGYEGFDGAHVLARVSRQHIDVDGYLGWGLTSGVALPVTSPAVNPLSDFQPPMRQIVAGLGAGWTASRFDVRIDYLREVDPDVDYFVSERVGMQAVARAATGLSIQAGSDWDLAEGAWGSAEAMVDYTRSRVSTTVGVKRYRPHFALWTIWGAFSPVPYHTTFGQVSVRATDWLDLRGRGERYGFEAANVSTALVQVESDGWRWSLGGTVSLARSVTVDGGYAAEFGPGASGAGWNGSIAYAPGPRLSIVLRGATLERPLEFRFDESRLKSVGLEAQADVTRQLRLGFGAVYYREDRRRPDAGAFNWNQVRLTARAMVSLGKGADFTGLPRAVRRMPQGES